MNGDYLLSRAGHYAARLRSMGHVRALTWRGYRGSRAVHIDAGARIIHPEGFTLGEWGRLCRDVKIECATLDGSSTLGRIEVADHVFIGERTTIVSYTRITIGRLTMIGHNCSITDGNHGVAPGTAMSQQPGRTAEVTIGEDCWLGAGVIVLPGVTIGNGTIVGAGGVVTRSLPENVLAAGVPARVIRPR